MPEFMIKILNLLGSTVFAKAVENRLEKTLQKWLIGRALNKTIQEFSKNKIWADIRERKPNNIDQIKSGFNTGMAFKIIEYYQEPDVSIADDKLSRIIEIWMLRAGVKTEQDRQYTMEAFRLFEKLVLETRKKFLANNDQFLIALQNHTSDISLKKLSREIRREINKQDSILKFVESINDPWEKQSSSFLDYRSGRVPFYGRQTEFIRLSEFCNCNGAITWWSVVALGGSGKSRLALEFCKTLKGLDWDCIYLNHALFDKMRGEVRTWQHSKNLFIVIDYVSLRAELIGQWLRALSDQRLEDRKIRILFLERTGFTDDKEPLWYENMRRGFGGGGSVLDDLCYTCDKQYLLKKLSDEDKRNIIKKTISNQTRDIEEADINKMIILLENIDNEEERPLFLLFIVQAYLDNETNWRNWNREELQQHIYRKEVNRIVSIVGDNPVCIERAELLWAFATLSGPIDISDVQRNDILLCKNERLANQGLTGKAIRKQMREICGGSTNDVVPYVPDIAGEFFILETLIGRNDIEAFMNTAWEHNGLNTAIVLGRLYSDYREANKYQQFLHLKSVDFFAFRPPGYEKGNILLYSILLVNISANALLNSGDAEVAVSRLRTLAVEHPDNAEITVLYAKGLVNLSNKQEAAKSAVTVDRLKALSEAYPDNAEISVVYAIGLANLINKQDAADVTATVDRLKTLFEAYSDNAVIAVVYAKGLFNLSNKQDAADAAATADRLKTLSEEHPDNAEIAVEYTKGLINLINKQEVTNATATVDRLKTLAEEHPDNAKITVEYAKGLVNLIIKQEATDAAATVDRLKTLAEEHPDNAEITVVYARGLVNLINKQEATDAAATVGRLKTLAEEYPDKTEIAVEYAGSLVNLSVDQDPADAEKTVDRLKALAGEHPDNQEIAFEYAKGLFNLSNKQEAADAAATVDRLKTLAEGHPGNEPFRMIFEFAQKLFGEKIKHNKKEK